MRGVIKQIQIDLIVDCLAGLKSRNVAAGRMLPIVLVISKSDTNAEVEDGWIWQKFLPLFTYQPDKPFLLSNSNASICDSFLSTSLEMGNAKSP